MITIRLLAIAAIGGMLGGCASEFSMRSLPPETPAAVNASAVRAAEAMEAAAKQSATGAPSAMAEGSIPVQPVQTGPGTTTNVAGAATASAGTPGASTSDTQEEPLVPLTDEDVPSMYT